MKVTILRGIPGSGKSTYICKNFREACIVSADDFFMEGTEYKFDPSKLPQAHAACLREYAEWLMLVERHRCWWPLVVDNTNTSVMEVAPYAALALAYGASLRIVTIKCDPVVAAARNVHGVPLRAVMAMAKRLEEETPRLAPWWEHEIVEV
jgi:predicted kinase